MTYMGGPEFKPQHYKTNGRTNFYLCGLLDCLKKSVDVLSKVKQNFRPHSTSTTVAHLVSPQLIWKVSQRTIPGAGEPAPRLRARAALLEEFGFQHPHQAAHNRLAPAPVMQRFSPAGCLVKRRQGGKRKGSLRAPGPHSQLTLVLGG